MVLPMVTLTRTDPKPGWGVGLTRSRISADTSVGRLTNVQLSARRASQIHSSASKVNFTRVSLARFED